MTSLHHATPHPTPTTRRAARPRRPLAQLTDLLCAAIGDGTEIMASLDDPWASALFEGRRCYWMIALEGSDAMARVDRFAEGLREAEWPMNGYFVADIQIDIRSSDPQGEILILSALAIRDW
jgi:hypothetical protein